MSCKELIAAMAELSGKLAELCLDPPETYVMEALVASGGSSAPALKVAAYAAAWAVLKAKNAILGKLGESLVDDGDDEATVTEAVRRARAILHSLQEALGDGAPKPPSDAELEKAIRGKLAGG